MATKSMAYDNPAYVTVLPMTGQMLAGASQVCHFAAFTQMIVKSVTLKAVVAGTSANDAISLIIRSAAGTSTTSSALTTFGSAVVTATNILLTSTLNQGDTISLLRGADATTTYAVTFESVVVPGANVTA